MTDKHWKFAVKTLGVVIVIGYGVLNWAIIEGIIWLVNNVKIDMI